jgi:hypothetical protein
VRDVGRRVGDAGQAVGIVVGVGGRLAVLVRGGNSTAAIVISECCCGGAAGIRDRGQPISRVVGEGGDIVQGVGDAGAVAVGVVLVGGDMLLRVSDRGN